MQSNATPYRGVTARPVRAVHFFPPSEGRPEFNERVTAEALTDADYSSKAYSRLLGRATQKACCDSSTQAVNE